MRNPEIENSILVDKSDEDGLDINIIIGNDFYSSLITGRFIKENGN